MQPNANNSQEALGLLQAARQGVQNPQAYLSQANQELGVDAARQSVTGLRGAINNTTKLLQGVAPSVMGRTRGSLVNAAQANRITQNEQAPIAANLSQQTQDYTQANADLSGLESRAAQQAALRYQGEQDKLSYLDNLYRTLYQREQDELARQERARAAAAQQAAQQLDIQRVINELNAKNAPAATPTEKVIKEYRSDDGNTVYGADTNLRSFQTDEGNRKQAREDRNERVISDVRNASDPLSKSASGWQWAYNQLFNLLGI